MTAEIRKLSGKRVENPVPGVIDVLERALAEAKTGRIRAVAVLTVEEGNDLFYHRHENGMWAALLAAHKMSEHAMLMDAYEAQRE